MRYVHASNLHVINIFCKSGIWNLESGISFYKYLFCLPTKDETYRELAEGPGVARGK